jgi:hypothetical protein
MLATVVEPQAKVQMNKTPRSILEKQASNKLFSFQLLVGNDKYPLREYAPTLGDCRFPSRGLRESHLDQVVYVQATPDTEFYARITFLDNSSALNLDNAWAVYLHVDGVEVIVE